MLEFSDSELLLLSIAVEDLRDDYETLLDSAELTALEHNELLENKIMSNRLLRKLRAELKTRGVKLP